MPTDGQPVPQTLGDCHSDLASPWRSVTLGTTGELEKSSRTFGRSILWRRLQRGIPGPSHRQSHAEKRFSRLHPARAGHRNLTAQMLKAGEFSKVEEARDVIHESFDIQVYR
ncbi:MAG: hypothetical protein ACLRT5_09630 [Lachnospiraceae bacterium]